MGKRLKLAIQKKGRLGHYIPPFLQQAGLNFEIRERQLISPCINYPLDLIFIRHRDVVPFVESGQADLGIVGSDMYEEMESKLPILLELGFAKSTLTIAVPKISTISDLDGLNGKTIATTFPRIATNFFKKENIPVNIITLGGSVEVAPQLEIADAIVDLVGTGTTMKLNGLRPLAPILTAQAILIGSTSVQQSQQSAIDELIMRMQSVQNAEKKKYVLFNIPQKNIAKVHAIFAGLTGPSIIPVESETPTVAIHVVVAAEEVWEKIVALRALEATGILVLPIDNLLP
ncbi:MAG: ATP phosphoribosyltransferase [bacterium]